MANNLLDDLKYIHQKDTYDALGVIAKQYQQLNQEYQIDLSAAQGREFSSIVHSGMGGSALWADFVKVWPGLKVPFEIIKDYQVPGYLGPQSLFIASSVSGNTEETLSALQQAEQAGAFIVVITSGGKLEQLAEQNNYPLLKLPPLRPPRYGMFNGLKGLVTILEQLNLLTLENATAQLDQASEFIAEQSSLWAADRPVSDNLAKQLALQAAGKSMVIYSGAALAPAAHKWKISFNENSKNIAWQGVFPEFNHNEFTGWTSHPVDKPYQIFYLLSKNDHQRVQRRFEISRQMLSGRWPEPQSIQALGENLVEELLWTITLGDFVSVYTALVNGVSPIEDGKQDIIERFKRRLAEPE